MTVDRGGPSGGDAGSGGEEKGDLTNVLTFREGVDVEPGWGVVERGWGQGRRGGEEDVVVRGEGAKGDRLITGRYGRESGGSAE